MTSLIANTILAGHWPYYLAIYLWPLVVLVEFFVLWQRHRGILRWWNALLTILIVNVVSFFVGGITNQGGFRGFESAPYMVIAIAAMVWAWAMSTVIEHLVLCLWLRAIPWPQCAKTSALMNLASYSLIITPALIWTFT